MRMIELTLLKAMAWEESRLTNAMRPKRTAATKCVRKVNERKSFGVIESYRPSGLRNEMSAQMMATPIRMAGEGEKGRRKPVGTSVAGLRRSKTRRAAAIRAMPRVAIRPASIQMAAFDSVKRGAAADCSRTAMKISAGSLQGCASASISRFTTFSARDTSESRVNPRKGEGRQRPVGGNRHEQRAYERPDDNANKHQWAIDNSAQAWTEYEQADSGYGLRCAQHNVTADQAAAKREQLVAPVAPRW